MRHAQFLLVMHRVIVRDQPEWFEGGFEVGSDSDLPISSLLPSPCFERKVADSVSIPQALARVVQRLDRSRGIEFIVRRTH